MILVKKLYDEEPDAAATGSEEEEEEVVENKWVAHNEREQKLYDYQNETKTAAAEAEAFAGEDSEFLQAHANIVGTPVLPLDYNEDGHLTKNWPVEEADDDAEPSVGE